MVIGDWSVTGCMLVLAVVGAQGVARGDEPEPTSAPDKWQFTLFNPTPASQLRDMDTDRPDKTNSPHTIDAGHVQLEFGLFDYAYDRDRYHGADALEQELDLGQLNFRLGVLNNFEVNAIINAADFSRATDYSAHRSSRQNGFGDLVVGGKFNFWGNDGADGLWQTALGIQPQFKIPTAREQIGNGHPELAVGFPLSINLPANVQLSVETTLAWQRNLANQGYVAGWENSASFDRVFFKKIDAYLEYWSAVSSEHHQLAQETLDVGFTYPLAPNLILDLGVNFGLNKASSSVEATGGASVRF